MTKKHGILCLELEKTVIREQIDNALERRKLIAAQSNNMQTTFYRDAAMQVRSNYERSMRLSVKRTVTERKKLLPI